MCRIHIIEAKKKFPNGKFEIIDLFKFNFKKKYDFVICSQVFNLKLSQDNIILIKKILPRLFGISKKGCVIDFLTSYVDFKEPHLYYYNPEVIFKIAKSISKKIQLRHDYELYEFSLYLFKDFKGWK